MTQGFESFLSTTQYIYNIFFAKNQYFRVNFYKNFFYLFKNKNILVTGSTSNIGIRIAKKLIENNAKVIINYGHNKNMDKETM